VEAVSMNSRAKAAKDRAFLEKFAQHKYLYLMSIPFVIWVFVFGYLPLWGWTMAF
jgi:putative aldouronate transport system permease protein